MQNNKKEEYEYHPSYSGAKDTPETHSEPIEAHVVQPTKPVFNPYPKGSQRAFWFNYWSHRGIDDAQAVLESEFTTEDEKRLAEDYIMIVRQQTQPKQRKPIF